MDSQNSQAFVLARATSVQFYGTSGQRLPFFAPQGQKMSGLTGFSWLGKNVKIGLTLVAHIG